jgi:hypothetical protein
LASSAALLGGFFRGGISFLWVPRPFFLIAILKKALKFSARLPFYISMNKMNTSKPVMYDYDTGEKIRQATAEELEQSIEAAKHDGGAGVITVDGRVIE